MLYITKIHLSRNIVFFRNLNLSISSYPTLSGFITIPFLFRNMDREDLNFLLKEAISFISKEELELKGIPIEKFEQIRKSLSFKGYIVQPKFIKSSKFVDSLYIEGDLTNLGYNREKLKIDAIIPLTEENYLKVIEILQKFIKGGKL
ncbi:MAG: hypothetical protein QW350_04155 [Candidatus Aenigmatarchaeota archaeon]